MFVFYSIPFVLEDAALLTAFIHPNHLGKLNSWGLIHLSPHCNSSYFGYSFRILISYGSFFSVGYCELVIDFTLFTNGPMFW
ncbi:MAG TPA: hypothetical protein DEV85_00300 [Vibrio sp.]|nr:hypothetical protein [Vibrio sp.]